MSNPILEAIQGKQLVRDYYGNVVELEEWSHEAAARVAEAEGLRLTDAHFQVLDFLREHAIHHGGLGQEAHRVLRVLEDRFAAQGGGRWLYTLFPGGPVRQGMRIAGLPPAPHDADPSFGSVT